MAPACADWTRDALGPSKQEGCPHGRRVAYRTVGSADRLGITGAGRRLGESTRFQHFRRTARAPGQQRVACRADTRRCPAPPRRGPAIRRRRCGPRRGRRAEALAAATRAFGRREPPDAPMRRRPALPATAPPMPPCVRL